MLAALGLALPAQAPGTVPALPQRPGLTIVSAVAGDTFLGNRRGDYEMAVTVASLSAAGAELTASSFVRNNAGKHEWLRFRRTVPASDLRTAGTQVLGFATEDVPTVPGTTSLGPSVLVMAEARQKGQVEFKVRNYADRRDNPGMLRRVGIEELPVLLNGRRVALPALHMRGQLGPDGHRRPWSFWFFDDPAQPITLKVSYGAEGAPETAGPEWLRQVIRIDVPDAESGAGVNAGAEGPEAGETEGGGMGTGANTGGGDGGAGAGTGPGGGTGTGAGAGGLGAMAGMNRDLGEVCRVTVPGVYFEFDSDALNPASAPWIGLVAEVLRRHPDWTVTIEGHTDSIGDPGYNQGLSVRRADALRQELVARHRIAAARLGTQGFGASRPLEPNTTLEGRARNRRVELVRPCGKPSRP
jgi:outer membrane protein OmpA-like peptidoglycan-associated protein